jgi:hypothetical protein
MRQQLSQLQVKSDAPDVARNSHSAQAAIHSESDRICLNYKPSEPSVDEPSLLLDEET